jgi:hypothetical protein
MLQFSFYVHKLEFFREIAQSRNIIFQEVFTQKFRNVLNILQIQTVVVGDKNILG